MQDKDIKEDADFSDNSDETKDPGKEKIDNGAVEPSYTDEPDKPDKPEKLAKNTSHKKKRLHHMPPILKHVFQAAVAIVFIAVVALQINTNIFIHKLGLDKTGITYAIDDIVIDDSGNEDDNMYIEYQKNDKKNYYIAYKIGGYEIGLYNIAGKLSAFNSLGSQYGKFTITDNKLSDSTMAKDMKNIKNILNVHASFMYPVKYNLATASDATAESSTAAETSTNTESVYIVRNNHYLYYFYTDKNGLCDRFEVYDRTNEDEDEIFRIRVLRSGSSSPTAITFPDGLSDGDYKSVTGEEFTKTANNFIVSALAATTSEDYLKSQQETTDSTSDTAETVSSDTSDSSQGTDASTAK